MDGTELYKRVSVHLDAGSNPAFFNVPGIFEKIRSEIMKVLIQNTVNKKLYVVVTLPMDFRKLLEIHASAYGRDEDGYLLDNQETRYFVKIKDKQDIEINDIYKLNDALNYIINQNSYSFNGIICPNCEGKLDLMDWELITAHRYVTSSIPEEFKTITQSIKDGEYNREFECIKCYRPYTAVEILTFFNTII